MNGRIWSRIRTIWLTDRNGPKTHGSYGTGSGTLVTVLTTYYGVDEFPNFFQVSDRIRIQIRKCIRINTLRNLMYSCFSKLSYLRCSYQKRLLQSYWTRRIRVNKLQGGSWSESSNKREVPKCYSWPSCCFWLFLISWRWSFWKDTDRIWN